MLLETFCFSLCLDFVKQPVNRERQALFWMCNEGIPPHTTFCDLFIEYLVIHGPSVNEQHSGEGVWYWNTFSKFSNPSPLVKVWKAFSLKIVFKAEVLLGSFQC